MSKGKADPAFAPDLKSGYTVDPGPYEAIVVGHVKSTRMGQLKVWIPDWGGRQNNPKSQATVSYCSPFYGTTFGTDSQNNPPGAFTSGMSYGMWMVPPDVGNKVLVTFAGGDRSRGYWFGCIYDSSSHHMVPGLGRNIGGSENTQIDTEASGPLSTDATSSSVLPVIEYNTDQSTAFTDLVNTPRIAHPIQSLILVNQGLDRDKIRGAISSSSMREAPSNCYGISTPGRSVTGNTAQDPSATDVDATQTVIARGGGHTFVMDDGDSAGVDRLIRLRTAAGHQILMNDTEQVLYIASSSGAQWMEFSADGSFNVYAKSAVNIRTEGILNLQGDAAVIINSGGPVQIHGDAGVSVSSEASVSVSAMGTASITADLALSLTGVGAVNLTSGAVLDMGAVGITNIHGAVTNLTGVPKKFAMPATATPKASLPDVAWNGSRWEYNPNTLFSACYVAPAHEPWIDPSTGKRPAPIAPTLAGALAGTIVGGVVGVAYGAASGAVGTVLKGGSS